MSGRLLFVISTGDVWRSATTSCLAVSLWVADVVIVVEHCDSDDPIV